MGGYFGCGVSLGFLGTSECCGVDIIYVCVFMVVECCCFGYFSVCGVWRSGVFCVVYGMCLIVVFGSVVVLPI